MNQMSIEFGVGKELRAARLKAELKVTDVAEELNLSVDHITAIEKDNYHELPGNTYVVGFVRSYARFLGLNDVHMVDRLMQSGLISSLKPSKPSVETEKTEDTSLTTDKKLIVRLLAGSFVVIVLILISFTVKNLPEEPEVQSIIEEDVVVPEAEPEAKTGTESAAEPKTKGLTDDEVAEMLNTSNDEKTVEKEKEIILVGTKPSGARVMLTALEDAWYQVYNDKTGRVYQNAVLKKGHSVWVQPGSNILMDLGRPHKMMMTIDGKELGTTGPSWGGVIKKLSADPAFLIYDFYGEGLNEKSYNRWKRKQAELNF